MGIYLTLYFGALILSLAFFFISKRVKPELGDRYYNLSLFLMVLMLFFFVFALYTHDPIEEILSTVPAFWQFALTALGGAFAIWKVYLNPLKEKVYAMDKELATLRAEVSLELAALKASLHQVEETLHDILNKMGSGIKKTAHKRN